MSRWRVAVAGAAHAIHKASLQPGALLITVLRWWVVARHGAGKTWEHDIRKEEKCGY